MTWFVSIKRPVMCLLGVAVLSLSACASNSIPKGFIYETSERGQQNWYGAKARVRASEDLLSSGVIKDPTAELDAALPEVQIDIRRWGVRYFPKNWKRYQVILDADISRDDETIKCRMVAPETPVGALTLKQVHANGGAAVQNSLEDLIKACVAKAH